MGIALKTSNMHASMVQTCHIAVTINNIKEKFSLKNSKKITMIKGLPNPMKNRVSLSWYEIKVK